MAFTSPARTQSSELTSVEGEGGTEISVAFPLIIQ